jgi:hypothetical protein
MALNKQNRELISPLQEITTCPNDIWRGIYADIKLRGGEIDENKRL